MAESWQEVQGRLKGQRAGMRILLQRAGVAMVKYRYRGEFISAELVDRSGAYWGDVSAQHADNLRHVAVAQLSANPGGGELWQRSRGVLEWILDEDVTISRRNFPGSDHDLEIGLDLRELAGACLVDDQVEPEVDRPHVNA